MRTLTRLVAFAVLVALPVSAQVAKPDTSAKKEPPPIADNSFLVEEAYNQEFGVVQHISSFQRSREGSWVYSFTQEWPAPAQRLQFSYSIAVVNPNVTTGVQTPAGPVTSRKIGAGIGDLAINFRWQAIGKDEEPLWFSPRLSLLLPTGDYRDGHGAGGPGLELNLPLSYQVSDAIVTHWNVGGNMIAGRNSLNMEGSTRNVRAGASAIWLLMPTFNFMLETVAGRFESLDDSGKRVATNSFLISPGVRGAINFASGLQIVPGIAVPIGVGPNSGQRDLLLYLSFEHPFRKLEPPH